MWHLFASGSLSGSLFFALFSLGPLAEAAQCYGINGQKTSGTQCSRDATGTGSSHSSCCDESRQEACLSSGLCFATQRGDNHTFWSQGCTDPTGMDPACPSYCGRSSQYISMPIQPSYTMLHCGSGAWCCCYDNLGMACNQEQCCARNFTLSRGLGTVTRQFDNNGDSVSISSNGGANPENTGDNPMPGLPANMPPWMRLVPVIAAGLLASLLLASIVALGFSCTQNRRLRRQVESLQNLNTSLTTEKLRSYSISRSSPTSSARPSVSAPSAPPLLITTAAANDDPVSSEPKTSVEDYLPPISARSPLTANTPSRSPHDGPSRTAMERRPSSAWVPENNYANEEPIRTPRTPITAAYHHHLSMVNQALGPSSARSMYGVGSSDPLPQTHPQHHHYQHPQEGQWHGPPGYPIAMPSPIRPAAHEEQRPSWPIREGQNARYTTYTQSGYFPDQSESYNSSTPPEYQYEVGGNSISELPGSAERGKR